MSNLINYLQPTDAVVKAENEYKPFKSHLLPYISEIAISHRLGVGM